MITTSDLSVADLKRLLTGLVAVAAGGLRVFVTSFAYRRGIPRDADLMFDVELAHRDLVQSGSPALVASGAPPAAS